MLPHHAVSAAPVALHARVAPLLHHSTYGPPAKLILCTTRPHPHHPTACPPQTAEYEAKLAGSSGSAAPADSSSTSSTTSSSAAKLAELEKALAEERAAAKADKADKAAQLRAKVRCALLLLPCQAAAQQVGWWLGPCSQLVLQAGHVRCTRAKHAGCIIPGCSMSQAGHCGPPSHSLLPTSTPPPGHAGCLTS